MTPVVAQAVGLAMFSVLRRMEFNWRKMLFGALDRFAVSPPPLDPRCSSLGVAKDWAEVTVA